MKPQLAKGRQPELAIDGELQFDAAFVPSTAEVKHQIVMSLDKQTSYLPDLQSGNIGYKIAQRLVCLRQSVQFLRIEQTSQ